MKKRNLLLVILAVLLVFGMVMSCGPVEEDIVIKLDVTANGTANTVTTTTLTLSFSSPDPLENPPSIGVGDISLSKGAKGQLSGLWPNYTLEITGVTSEENLTVTVKKTGYTTASGSVAIHASAKDQALKYFGDYQANYMLSGTQTIEYIRINNNASTLTIEEVSQGISIDKLVFAIDGWEIASVPSTEVNADESERGTFTVGFKVKGKVTEASDGYKNSSKTMPGVNLNDSSSYIQIYLADWKVGGDLAGYLLLRSAISSSSKTNSLTGVTGDSSKTRVYLMEIDD